MIVTSHSPDLLDDKSLDPDAILAVASEKGTTRISKLDEASRTAMRERLYTAGELLRANQLAPEASDSQRQRTLFDNEDGT